MARKLTIGRALRQHSPAMDDPAIVVARNLRKAFAGVVVLDDVSFDVNRGEVHTLLGENGAGKSTLMKILGGVHRPDAGDVLIDGAAASLTSPHAAQRHGIALIHQEPVGFPDLGVAENIFIARDVPRGSLGQVDWAVMRGRASELLAS